MNNKLLNRLARANGIDVTMRPTAQTPAPANNTREQELEERVTELEAALDLLLRGVVNEDAEA